MVDHTHVFGRQEWARQSLIGVALLIAMMVVALTPLAGQQQDPHGSDDEGTHDGGPSDRFGRMFHLPPFAAPTPAVTAALIELGQRGGLMDANDQLSAGPVQLIVDPALSLNNPNNENHTAGVTFVGQFLDHDMTFDTTSRLGRPANPRRTPNARRPYFDLDSVYGDGPSGSPQLYEAADLAKFRVESGGLYEDLPRDETMRAIVADPRNDETVAVAGLQAAFLLFHNRVVDRLRLEDPTIDDEDAFTRARQQTTWHYQWLIVHEFLPLFVGAPMVDRVLAEGPRYFRPREGRAFIPVEFQMAYRFGHTLVRPSYRANFTGMGGAPFFAMIFDTAAAQGSDPSDVRGGARAARRFVGWSTFFRFPGLEGDTRPNKRVDTKLSTPLFDLPLGAIASGQPPTSLAQRNLLRHLTWSLPSGQAIARAMGAPVVPAAQFAELAAVHPSFVRSTPLWYYVLREGDLFGQGAHLGPVGGRIVAEVFLGLLQADPDSMVHVDGGFQPSLGPSPGEFRMIDFLNFAGVGGRR